MKENEEPFCRVENGRTFIAVGEGQRCQVSIEPCPPCSFAVGLCWLWVLLIVAAFAGGILVSRYSRGQASPGSTRGETR
jgi:hypothetical protein